MRTGILYIHGKGGNAGEANHYRALCKDADVLGVGYRADTPWGVKEELREAYESAARVYGKVGLIANSIGAFYAMHALADKAVSHAFFISPIVDMEGLICGRMAAAQVTEEELRRRQEIRVDAEEPLSWRYLCYVREHPVVWTAPTDILYADGDVLTAPDTVAAFARKTRASLTVMENGEHWFHTDEQMKFLDRWIQDKGL